MSRPKWGGLGLAVQKQLGLPPFTKRGLAIRSVLPKHGRMVVGRKNDGRGARFHQNRQVVQKRGWVVVGLSKTGPREVRVDLEHRKCAGFPRTTAVPLFKENENNRFDCICVF